MNKQELVAQLAKRAKISVKDAKAHLEHTLDLITSSLKNGEKVTLTGFGSFESVVRKAATRFNPQTRRPIQVPAKRVPKFRAGKNLKQAVHKSR